MRIIRYERSLATNWDSFLQSSKNGLFLFQRAYMDYHASRFKDHSLFFLDENDRCVAILPANVHDGHLISHGGLTFGGIVCTHRMTTSLMLSVFDTLHRYAMDEGLVTLRYKAVPHMYHRLPSEEDLYALFRNSAKVFKREVTSVIDMRHRIPLSKGRKSSISKAKRLGIVARESSDVHGFMAIAESVLRERHNTKPVHTAAEIDLLVDRFPDNIRLFAAFLDDRMCAGVVMYLHDRVAHVQYMAATEIGRECGALDLVVFTLLEEVFFDIPFFDFGISTERDGTLLNAGLVAQKEMFGGRAMIHETFDLEFT